MPQMQITPRYLQQITFPTWLLAAALLLTLFSAEAMSQGNTKEPNVETTAPAGMDLYLLAGQSNMAGRGRVGGEDKHPIPRVFVLSKDLKWKPAVAPLHFDKPGLVGVGVGRAFAKAMLKDDDKTVIGLIPTAVGGSPIDSWKPGGYHRQTKSHPWDDAIRRANHALKSGQLKGILWHQGESDSKPGLAEAYEKKLHDLIGRFRSALKAKDVPFVAGQMGQFSERPWNDSKRMVDKAHRTLPDAVGRTAIAPSNGLQHKGDQVHFDAKSYRALGGRFAKAMMSLAR